MKKQSIIFLCCLANFIFAQDGLIKPGNTSPSFVLNLPKGGTQGFSMPYMGRIVLLHFYSTSVSKSLFYNKPYNRLAKRYKDAIYKGAEGFEVIEIAVQSDKGAWNEAIQKDSLNDVINGIALRGYNDDICKKYGITQVPTDVLVDEKGLVVAVNPRITLIEEILDEKKNFQPIKKDVIGKIAYSSNSSDVFKFAKVYLFNAYGDSLDKALTDENGSFIFSEIKLNQDFILKVDNGADITLSDPIAIFNQKGERVVEAKSIENGFVFYIPSNLNSKILDRSDESPMEGKITEIDVSKHLTFKNNGADLTPKDEFEIKGLLDILNKNKGVSIDIIGHTSTKLDAKQAQTLSLKHVNTIKTYLIKKGISQAHIKVFTKGNSEPLKNCQAQNCNEQDHAKNQRVEFKIYKD